MNLQKISLVICSYNRAQSLAQSLDCLTVQNKADLRQLDVLVVDNNSDDDTEVVVLSFKDRLPIRYQREISQGLSYARNRGISESLGETIIFTDDDVFLDTGWLSAYRQAFETFPNAGYFGGRIRPDWTDCPRPSWLKNEQMPLLSGVLVCHDLGETSRPYSAQEDSPFGASFAVRRAVFAEHGVFRTDLGVKGESRGRGEETEFLNRARAGGVSGIYVGEALCWHRVDRGRLTLPSLYLYGVESGIAHKVIKNVQEKGSFYQAAGFIVRGVRQLVLGHGDRFRQCIINAGIQVGFKR